MRRLVECLPVLVLWGCWEPHENSLFKPEGAQSSLTGGDTSAGSSSGGSGSSAGYGYGAVAGEELPQTGGTTPYPLGGSGGSHASGGADKGGAGGTTPLAGGEGGSGNPPSPVSCDMIDGAVTHEGNGHCYRASLDQVDFATAQEACRVVGAHLVTISSEDENTFVSKLLPSEHWLGATDGKSNTTNGVGEYVWVNAEPWSYSDWREGQPNAKETGCPTEAEGSACYEHCAYQSDQVDWVDRSCWHTIPSVCEWDLEPGGP